MRWLWLVTWCIGAVGSPQEPSSPAKARLSAVSLWVKVRSNAHERWQAGRLGLELSDGDRILTEKRSQAEIRFFNQNTLRMAASGKVRIVPDGLQIEGGRIIGDCPRPGVIYSPRASIAFKEARFEHIATPSGDTIRCFSGEAMIFSKGTNLRAGLVESGSPASISTFNLIGMDRSFKGGTIRLYNPDGAFQEREIASVDSDTGSVTVNSPFSPAPAYHSSYILIAPGSSSVILISCAEVIILPDATSLSPRPVASFQEEDDLYRDVPSGQEVLAYPGSMAHERYREERYLLREGVSIEPLHETADYPTLSRKGSGSQPFREGGSGRQALSLEAQAMGAGSEGGPVWSYGLRASVKTGDSSRLTIAGRKLSFDNRERSDFVEVFFENRSESSGDWKAGRFLFYPAPANNLSVGALIPFEIAEGAIWSPFLLGERPLTLGYFSDTDPLLKKGFSGWYLRFRGGFRGSLAGATLLKAGGKKLYTGSSLDVSIPVVLHVLDAYGEYGEDPFKRRFYMAGLYFPWLYRQTGLDLFVEYGGRKGFPHETSTHLSYDLDNRLTLLATYENVSRRNSAAGIGVLYRVEMGR